MVINEFAKLSSPSRKATLASLVVIAVLLLYNQIVAPQVTYLRAAEKLELATEGIASKNTSISTTVEASKKDLQKLREQVSSFRDTLFTPEKTRQFFSDLEVISQQAGCSVTSLRFVQGRQDTEVTDASGVVATGAVLNVVGTYKSVTELLKRLQSRSEEVWIDSLRMQIVDYRSAHAKCDITITVYTIEHEENSL
ncbi:MAG: hypothetical protein ACYS8I_16875 [Planctomycetota bacterium]|jgi:hypothetical protein